jgi:hypothetical protein
LIRPVLTWSAGSTGLSTVSSRHPGRRTIGLLLSC